jgi:hypothetical protein
MTTSAMPTIVSIDPSSAAVGCSGQGTSCALRDRVCKAPAQLDLGGGLQAVDVGALEQNRDATRRTVGRV